MSKPIDQLSLADLQTHPIWEYTDDEEDRDETYVRPVQSTAVPREMNHCVYLVACDIVAVTGAKFIGFMSVANGELHESSPVVVGEQGNYWPLDLSPTRRDRSRFEAFFGCAQAALLPVQWKLRVPFAGEATLLSGTFSGA